MCYSLKVNIMRLIAFSIIVFTGSVMAAAGTLAESMPEAKRYSVVDEWGLAVVVAGILLFVVELISMKPKPFVSMGLEAVGASSPSDIK